MLVPNNMVIKKHKFKIINTLKGIEKFLSIKLSSDLFKVEKLYPVLVTQYYLGLVKKKNIPADPIWKQCVPTLHEMQDDASSEDPQCEEIFMPVPKLISRYKDRAVLLATGSCFTQCRFCFRKRYFKERKRLTKINKDELDKICDYLAKNPDIKEVLVSGGDPLTLTNREIKQIVNKISSIENIEVIRLATRAPVVCPSRINGELIEILTDCPGLWVATHFNHPIELTSDAIKACKLIINAGIPIINQTVLLKGVNDNANILEQLYRMLIKNKIKPHYLFHVDPVRGVKHFATGIKCGLHILEEFRGSLSSLAVPHFAIDLPEGGGKVALQPIYGTEKSFLSIEKDRCLDYFPGLE